jgi:hypothetical protein
MEKGYVYNVYPENVPSAWDMVWIDAVKANTINPQVYDNWNKIKGVKKGLIHHLALTQEATLDENGTKMHVVLGNIIEDKFPLLINIYDSTAGAKFELHQIRAYLEYLYARYEFNTKPILRILAGTWNSWYDGDGYSELKKIMDMAEPLIIGWGADKPSTIKSGDVRWFEYGVSKDPQKALIGYIAYDETGQWEKSPQEPVVVVPPVPPVPADPPDDDDEDDDDFIELIYQPLKWKVNLSFDLLGFIKGSITGTIEAEELDEIE